MSYPNKPTPFPEYILKFFTPKNLLGSVPLSEMPGQHTMISGMSHLKYHLSLLFCFKPPPLWEPLHLARLRIFMAFLVNHSQLLSTPFASLLAGLPSIAILSLWLLPSSHTNFMAVFFFLFWHLAHSGECSLVSCTFVLRCNSIPTPLLIHSGNRSRIISTTLRF